MEVELMLIGYARVSMPDQNISLQKDALKKAGCKKIFQDHMSGAKEERSGLERAMEVARKGDILVVWRLDRLGQRGQRGRSGRAWRLAARGVEGIDTPVAGVW